MNTQAVPEKIDTESQIILLCDEPSTVHVSHAALACDAKLAETESHAIVVLGEVSPPLALAIIAAQQCDAKLIGWTEQQGKSIKPWYRQFEKNRF